MPRSTPDEREGDFVPQEKAQEFGFYGTPVSEYPNEMYTANEIVKRLPGGPVGVSEEEAKESAARQVPDASSGGGGNDDQGASDSAPKPQEAPAEKSRGGKSEK